MNVFELFAKLGMDTSEYDKKLNESESKGANFGKGLVSAAKVGTAAVAAVGTAAIGAGAALVKGAGKVASYGDNIDKMSQKMGISAKAYQEWDAVMQHSGTSIEALKPSMKTLANQAEKGSDAFQKLGISQEEVKNLSQEDLFAKTIEGLQNMEEGTERTALTSQLLGRGATELGALLNTSAEDTQKMKDRVHELGGVMSDEAVKAAAAYQDQLQDMQTGFDSLKRNLLSEFMPGITTVMGGLTELFTGNYTEGLDKISEGVSGLVEKLADALPKVIEVGGKIVESLATAIVQNIPTIFPALVDLVLSIGQTIISNLPTLLSTGVQMIQEIVQGISQGLPELVNSALDILVNLTGDLDKNMSKLITEGGKMLESIIDGIIKNLPKVVTSAQKILTNILTALTNNLPKLLEMGAKLITQLASGLLKSLPTVITNIGNIISKLLGYVIDNLPKLLEMGMKLIIQLAQGLVKALPNIIESLANIITNILNKLISAIPQLIQTGMKLIAQLAVGLVKALPDILKALANIVKNILSSFTKVKWGEIGINIIKGIISGIGSMASQFLSAIVNLAKSAFDGIKDFFGIHSPSKKMRDEIGKNIVKGLIEGVNSEKNNAKKNATELSALYVSAAKSKFDALVKNNKLSEAEEVAYWQAVLQHVKKGTKAYNDATKQLGTAKASLNKSIDSLSKEYTSGVKKITQELDKAVTDLQDSYNKAVEERKKSITSQMGLFDMFEGKEKQTGEQLTDSLESQVSGLKAWNNTMSQLHDKLGGTAPELYKELNNMGVEQLHTLETINDMSELELQNYIELYNQKQELAQARAEKDNEELKKQTDAQIEELKVAADKQIAALEKKYKKGIKKLGLSANKEFKKAGVQSIAGMQEGMNEQFAELTKDMMAQAQALAKSVKKALKIKSPSKLFADEVGKWIPLGIAEGFDKAMPLTESRVLNSLDSLTSGITDYVNSADMLGNIGAVATFHPHTEDWNKHEAQGMVQNLTINAPTALMPSEIARQTRLANQQMVLALRGV